MPGGLRHNEGKNRLDLIPPEWITALGEVLTKGANKYEDRNWEKGMDWSKCYASLLRHAVAFWDGEDCDPETGLPHPAHVAWNALALLTYMSTHPDEDDRPSSTVLDRWGAKPGEKWVKNSVGQLVPESKADLYVEENNAQLIPDMNAPDIQVVPEDRLPLVRHTMPADVCRD